MDTVRFDANGLVPVIVQEDATQRVLMLAFMNAEALRLTQETGRAHYWSRSRGKLWRKGETSGNEQVVTDLRVNCEQNSLLMTVLQQGAVCHDGYATCYYRRLNDDSSLEIVEERQFDPATVYGSTPPTSPSLAALTQRQVAAYQHLRDHDLTAESGTSRFLRNAQSSVASRVADELDELAGVLAGEHVHGAPAADTMLEASQVIYWLLVEGLRTGLGWERLRPDLLLAEPAAPSRETVIRLLRASASEWRDASAGDLPHIRATLVLVGAACSVMAVDPVDVITADLNALQERPYLATFFTAQG